MIDNLWIFGFKSIFETDASRLVIIVEKIVLVCQDHNYVILCIRTLLYFIDPVRHVLDIILIREIAHNNEASLISIELGNCALN